MSKCVFQGALQHVNANIEETPDSVPVPSHLLLLHTKASSGEKTPDYAIYPKDTKVIAEVKDIQESPTERQQREHFERVGWSTFGSGKVGDRARDIIGTAAKQLKRMAKGKCPAMIVIYNPSLLLRHHTEPHAIKAAMYGFDTVILGLAPIYMQKKPRLIDRKSGSGRKVGSQFNCKPAGTEVRFSSKVVSRVP